LLPHHRREQLVSFYYLWKKSRDATRPKPLSNNAKRNQVVAAVGRRGKNGVGANGGGHGITGIFGNGGFVTIGGKMATTENGAQLVAGQTAEMRLNSNDGTTAERFI
jgi:hypothetical protein